MEGGLVFSFMDYRELEILLCVGGKLGFTLLNILVWDKGRGGMGGLYRNACEFIRLFKSGKGRRVPCWIKRSLLGHAAKKGTKL